MDIKQEIERGNWNGSIDGADLDGLPIVGRLSPDMAVVVARATRWRRYHHRETVASPRKVETRTFVVVAGTVRVYLLIANREFVDLHLERGHVFDLALMPPRLSEIVHLEAMVDDTVVFWLPREVFRNAVLSEPAAAGELLDQERARMWELTQILEAFAYHSTRTRLAHILVYEASKTPDGYLGCTQDELAEMSALPRPVVNKLLIEYRDLELVASEPHKTGHTIIDPDGLMRL